MFASRNLRLSGMRCPAWERVSPSLLLAGWLDRGAVWLVPPYEVIGPWAFFSAIEDAAGRSICHGFVTFGCDRLCPTCPLPCLLAGAK